MTRGCTIGVANPNGTSTKEGKKTLKGRPLLLVFKHAKTKNLRTRIDGPADHQSLAHVCVRLIILNRYHCFTVNIRKALNSSHNTPHWDEPHPYNFLTRSRSTI
jgi:hypothetical protein